MTQETVDMVIHAYCEGCQEFIGDYDLVIQHSPYLSDRFRLVIVNKSIESISLPFEIIKESFTPKEKAKVIISLLEQIIENGDQWLQDEENYHGDKLAERWDNQRKSNLENN